ncbi:MAG: hypothetical protein P8012_08305, partial [Desulfobacterales bacterium]
KIYILNAEGKSLPYKIVTTIFISFILSVSLIFLALDTIPRYMSWYTLDKAKITSNAISYSRNAPVCLYVVECSSGVPEGPGFKVFFSISSLSSSKGLKNPAVLEVFIVVLLKAFQNTPICSITAKIIPSLAVGYGNLNVSQNTQDRSATACVFSQSTETCV